MANENIVEYEKVGDVAFLRLNQPDSLNALTDGLAHTLSESVDRASASARAIVLGSRGRAFCSGASLTGGGGINLADPNRDLGGHLEKVFNPLMRKLRDLPVPYVTAVRGAAAGIGAPIALMGDIIVAGKSAYFLQAFCNIGLVPDGGSAFVLTRAVGRVRAMEMMLLGERYPAERALADGLITRLVEDDKVDETALEFAQRLARGPTRAYALIRRLAWKSLDMTLDEELDLERILQRDACRTDDFIEGVSAFRDKRKAAFRGK